MAQNQLRLLGGRRSTFSASEFLLDPLEKNSSPKLIHVLSDFNLAIEFVKRFFISRGVLVKSTLNCMGGVKIAEPQKSLMRRDTDFIRISVGLHFLTRAKLRPKKVAGLHDRT